jgi:hypothetical protein
MENTRRQLTAFALLLGTNALLAFLLVAMGMQDQLAGMVQQDRPNELASIPPWVLGLANAGIILFLYGVLGLAGLWFARKLGLPGVFRERAGWRNWVTIPLVLGLVAGVILVVADCVFASLGDWEGLAHPAFPASLIASATAGIGEEIVFRVFVMGLWASLFSLLLRRGRGKGIVLWGANVMAALAFAAGHLPTMMLLFGVSSPAQMPPLVLVELFLLNGVVGLVAGERYMRDGLVAAAGVHFWTDVVWHVIWPLIG